MQRSDHSHACVLEVLEFRRLLSASAAAPLGITGEYFSGDDFQTPAVVRADSRIDFNWIHGRPDSAVAKGAFTARWTGTVTAPATGDYTFYTVADSGTQVIVNGTTLIDNFTSRTASAQQGTISLTAGQPVSIQVEYVSKGTGAAKMQLLWSGAGLPKKVVPKSALVPATGVSLPGNQPLVGTYYTGFNFGQEVMTRTDSEIDFDFGTGVPDSVIPLNTPFSVQWTGQITPKVTGKYSLETITDDGVRLFIDGQKIIGDWRVHSAQADYAGITLQAGQSYNVLMEYFQDGVGHGSAKLLWAQAGHVERFVHFTPPITLAAPLDLTAQPFSDSQINLTWDDVPNETGFTIERSTDGGATFTADGTTGQGITTFSDTGLTASTPYVYEVIATNGAATSPASAEASATTLAAVPASAVASATVSGTTATVSWTAVTGATSYLVERSPNGTTNWTSVGSTAGNSVADTTLSDGTTYYYRVTSSNASGSAAPSNVVTAITAPAAPTLAATAASDTLINLTWNDVTGETGFIVQQSADGVTNWTQTGATAAGTTTLAVAGLTGGTTYHFRVIAVDAGGNSAPSNVASATTNAAAPSYASLTTLYGLAGTGVYSINTTTGVPTQIGTLSFTTDAAGRDPVSGHFYYVSAGTSTVAISAWNPTNNTNSVINASVPLDGAVSVAAFRDDGTFFVISAVGDLYAIDRVTGDATLKGTLKVSGTTLDVIDGDIAFGPDNTMYLCTNGNLYTVANSAIQAATGSGSSIATTLVDNTGLGNLQIAFGEDGTLYGTSASGQLYSGQSTSSPATLVGTPSGVAYGDLASVPLNADLTITQSASTFTAGQTGTYSINVTNDGPDATVGPIQVIDTLPAGLSYVAGSGTGWTFSVNGSVVTMTYDGSVHSGAIPTATLTVQIDSAATSPVVNTVAVSTTIFDPETSNNTSTISTVVS